MKQNCLYESNSLITVSSVTGSSEVVFAQSTLGFDACALCPGSLSAPPLLPGWRPILSAAIHIYICSGASFLVPLSLQDLPSLAALA